MRVAVCFSGQPRHIADCAEGILEKIIRPLNADVFVHCWFDPKTAGEEMVYSPWGQSQLLIPQDKVPEDVPQLVQRLYAPKSASYEPQIQFDVSCFEGANFESMSAFVLPSMWYSIQRSNALKQEYEKENGFRYDVVIRMRFDLDVRHFKIWTELPLDLSIVGDVLFCPGYSRQPNDWLLFAKSHVMDVVAEVYDNIQDYWQQDKLRSMVSEVVLAHHLQRNKIALYNFHRGVVDIGIHGRRVY